MTQTAFARTYRYADLTRLMGLMTGDEKHGPAAAEIGSGSLGHGLPLAVGTALGLRAQGLTDPRVWVLVGDAELDEGSNHEALEYAGPARPAESIRPG